jgi:hypothetical protein
MRDDRNIWPALVDLASCLCAEFEGEGFCFCGVVSGQVVAADYGDDGMAWVRLVSSFPSATFPQGDQEPGCHRPLAHQIEVGVMRCAPSFDGTDLPGVDEWLEATRLHLADQAAMLRAIRCCFDNGDREVVIGTFTPMGPAGGVLGGNWNIWVEGS